MALVVVDELAAEIDQVHREIRVQVAGTSLDLVRKACPDSSQSHLEVQIPVEGDPGSHHTAAVDTDCIAEEGMEELD